MPLHLDDTQTANAVLDGWLGPNRTAGAPDSYDVELWQDDPRNPGATEADWGGYTPPTLDSDDWDDADAGQKETTGLVSFGAPSSGGTDAARFWALRNATSGEIAFSAPLGEPIHVGAASANPVQIRPVVRHASN